MCFCVFVCDREWMKFLNINLPLKSQKYNNYGHFKRRLLVLHCYGHDNIEHGVRIWSKK